MNRRPSCRFLARLSLFLVLLGTACRPNTDATIAPPQIPAGFKIDVPPVREDGRLSEDVQPSNYRLHLRIDPSKDAFQGEVFVDLVLSKPQSAFVLHASNLVVDASEVQVGSRRIRSDVEFRQAAGSKGEKEELVVLPARPIPAGKATLHITYHAPLGEKPHGIYRVNEKGKPYVFTQFEPSDARRMLPCFDDPIYKVPFELSVDVPRGQQAFSNTPLQQKKELPKSKQTRFVFRKSKAMPTYLVALAIGDLEVLAAANHKPPIRVITTPGKSEQGRMALQMAKEQLAIFERWFRVPYPYAKLDLVAVPNFSAGAMENAGLVTFREELLLLDNEQASAASKRRVAMVMAHELAHHWFGNLVTMKWWDDLWLNEGFASFMEADVVDAWRPAMRAGLGNLSSTGWVMGIDALPSARAIRKPISNTYQALAAFDGITYVKGSAVIEMLQAWLGREAFLKGLHTYFQTHAWKNASASDAFAALSKASNKDVAQVASTFLDQAGVPLVRSEVKCERGQEAKLQLSQQPFRYDAGESPAAASSTRWQIPVCVRFAPPGRRSKSKRLCTLLSKPSQTVSLGFKGCPRWLQPNADHRGYYRYLVDAKNFRLLVKAKKELGIRDRIGLLTNAWAMVQANHLSADDLLKELPRFKDDEREVIREVIAILTGISDSIQDTGNRRALERFVSRMFLRRAKKLGWESAANDTDERRLLRKDLLQALADLSPGRWMRRESARRAKKFLKAPNSLNPDTASIALQVAAQSADPALPLDGVLVRLKSATQLTERILLVGAVAHFPTKGNWAKTFDLLLDGSIRSQDTVYVVRSAARNRIARKELIAWLEKNASRVGKRMPQSGLQLMTRAVSRICTDSLRKRAIASLKEPAARHGAERRLNEALERSTLCINMARRQSEALQRLLRAYR